jgi:hypothetical protein
MQKTFPNSISVEKVGRDGEQRTLVYLDVASFEVVGKIRIRPQLQHETEMAVQPFRLPSVRVGSQMLDSMTS